MCYYSYVLLHTKIVFIPAKSNILPRHISHHLREITWHFIWLHSVNNWDRGLVHCGTNNLCGCWLFGQNEIQVYRGASWNIVAGNRQVGSVTSCRLIWLLSVKLGIVVLSTVVPTSFVAVDSLDKTRFRFIALHRIFSQGTLPNIIAENPTRPLPYYIFAVNNEWEHWYPAVWK